MVKAKEEHKNFVTTNISFIFSALIAIAGLAVSWGINKEELDHLKEELHDIKANIVNHDKIENLRILITNIDKEILEITSSIKDLRHDVTNLERRGADGKH